jgi:hypothetical protein
VADDDHVGAPLLGELDDRVRGLADRALIVGLDSLAFEIRARRFKLLGVLLGRSVESIGPAERPALSNIGVTLVTTSFAPSALASVAARSSAFCDPAVSSYPTTIVLIVAPQWLRGQCGYTGSAA